MSPVHTKFYRDKANGKLFGVCAGLADYIGVDVLWVRLAMVMLALTTGFSIPLYIVMAMLAEAKPQGLYASSDEQRFWQGVRQSPARATREVRSQFRDIDRRLAAVEAYYVSSNPRLAEEIEKLR